MSQDERPLMKEEGSNDEEGLDRFLDSIAGMGTCGDGLIFGFGDMDDWIESIIFSFPAPWSVSDLDGKYYGTDICDGAGLPILTIWISEGSPSVRELRGHPLDSWFTEDNPCDSHWESHAAYSIASVVVDIRNSLAKSKYRGTSDFLTKLVLGNFSWHKKAFKFVRCGGPDRRLLAHDPEIRKHFTAYAPMGRSILDRELRRNIK